MNHRRKLLATLLTGLAVAIGCSPTEPTAVVPPRVAVMTVRRETLRNYIDTFGTVASLEQADVTSIVEGATIALYAEVGDTVRQGDPLLRIDDRQLRARRDQIESRLEAQDAAVELARIRVDENRRDTMTRLIVIDKARDELNRRRVEQADLEARYQDTLRLFEIGGISQEQLERMETSRITMQSAIRQAQYDLAISSIGFGNTDLQQAGYDPAIGSSQREAALITINATRATAELSVARANRSVIVAELRQIDLLLTAVLVHAPISGTIGARNIHRGETVSIGEPLVTIIGDGPLFVAVQISESDVPKLRLEDRATVRWNENEFEGTVTIIAPYVDTRSGTTMVRITLAESAHRLTPGMFTEVRIEVGEPRGALVVPSSAVVEQPDGIQTLFVVRDSRLRRIIVTGERIDDDIVAILEGVRTGDLVVIDGAGGLRNGMLVEAAL